MEEMLDRIYRRARFIVKPGPNDNSVEILQEEFPTAPEWMFRLVRRFLRPRIGLQVNKVQPNAPVVVPPVVHVVVHPVAPVFEIIEID